MTTFHSSAATSSQGERRPFRPEARRTRAPRDGPSCARERVVFRRTTGANGSKPWRFENRGHYVTHSTGVGKSYLACALAQQACRDGHSALYTRAPQLFRDLQAARGEGALTRLLTKLARIDVLGVDDFAIAPMSELERRDFLDLCADRYRLRSTVLTSQLASDHWHEVVGDPTVADSIPGAGYDGQLAGLPRGGQDFRDVPVLAEGDAVEEAQGRDGDADRAGRELPGAGQEQLVVADLLGAESLPMAFTECVEP